MKKSWMVGVKDAELTFYEAEPTLEFLRKHASEGGTGFVEMIKPQVGVEAYFDEDGRIKSLAPGCTIRWKKGEATEVVTLVGPVLLVFPRAKTRAQVLAKLVTVLKGVFVSGQAGGLDYDDLEGGETKKTQIH